MNCGNLGEGCGRRDFLGDTNTPGPNDLKIGHLGKVCTLCTFSHQTLHTIFNMFLDHFESKKCQNVIL